jgi:hypothetical protein
MTDEPISRFINSPLQKIPIDCIVFFRYNINHVTVKSMYAFKLSIPGAAAGDTEVFAEKGYTIRYS